MKIKRRENLAWQKLGESTIIIDTQINKQVHQLNEVGGFLWTLLESSQTQLQLCQILQDEYEVDELLARQDLSQFLKDLELKSLIEIS